MLSYIHQTPCKHLPEYTVNLILERWIKGWGRPAALASLDFWSFLADFIEFNIFYDILEIRFTEKIRFPVTSKRNLAKTWLREKELALRTVTRTPSPDKTLKGVVCRWLFPPRTFSWNHYASAWMVSFAKTWPQTFMMPHDKSRLKTCGKIVFLSRLFIPTFEAKSCLPDC